MTEHIDATAGDPQLRLHSLHAIAEAATPGPWHWVGDAPGTNGEYPSEGCPHEEEWIHHGPDLFTSAGPEHQDPVLAAYGYDTSGLHISPQDAAFIATFHPGRVTELLDRLRRVEAENAKLRQDVADLRAGRGHFHDN